MDISQSMKITKKIPFEKSYMVPLYFNSRALISSELAIIDN